MESQKIKVSLSIELDEKIYQCMQEFLDSNPQWSSESLFNASLSLFLMQNHKEIDSIQYRACAQKYLHSVCSSPYQNTQLN